MAFGIHAHFYQPPREDPLTGEVPLEPGASPYHDWNQKIDDRCYKPNAALHNFSRISFNVGPTLFEWLFKNDHETYDRIVKQDVKNNAMAQSENHTILPLAKRHDKDIQVYWGIADFEYRFGRKPHGMWLPETAVDYETLDVLVQNGIGYTILAPWQLDVHDKGQPYKVRTDSGEIIAFPYQDISGKVSFEDWWTENADRFAEAIQKQQEGWYFLIATDGELYGEHKQWRDKFLEQLTEHTVKDRNFQFWTPYDYLQNNQVKYSANIFEKTSWSCHHGVKRWEDECGCAPNQTWKRSLRDAMNLLADDIDEGYLSVCNRIVSRPWELLKDYIHVMLGEMTDEDLIRSYTARSPDEPEMRSLKYGLKAQREKQRMFTSCGWFFDDFDRIEPKNNVAYAAAAANYSRLSTGVDIGSAVVCYMERIVSPKTGLRADSVFGNYNRQLAYQHV